MVTLMSLFDNVIILFYRLYIERRVKMLNEDGKTERIALRITKEYKDLIKELAKKENRTLSNWCESAIIEKVKKDME